jgi:hypothetical protein
VSGVKTCDLPIKKIINKHTRNANNHVYRQHSNNDNDNKP